MRTIRGDNHGNEAFRCNLIESAWYDAINGKDSRYLMAAYAVSFFVLLTFAASTFSNNYSQVDKLWSILPVIYAWIFVVDLRTLFMACLVTLWGVRLTYNFYRRGGYHWPPWRGEEDYRWSHVRRGEVLSILTNPIIWSIFNFFFVSLYQNVIIFLMASPSVVAYTMAFTPACQTNYSNNKHLGWLDTMAALSFLSFVLVESIADNQQLAFQQGKYRYYQELAETTAQPETSRQITSSDPSHLQEYQDGFCQSGLFAIVRKPNYAAEQGVWLSYFFFSVAAGAPLHPSNWSIVGVFFLVILFQGTGWLTERISQSKYPRYQEYKRRVPLYVPNLFRLFWSKQKHTI